MGHQCAQAAMSPLYNRCVCIENAFTGFDKCVVQMLCTLTFNSIAWLISCLKRICHKQPNYRYSYFHNAEPAKRSTSHCVCKPVHGVCKPAFSNRSNPMCYDYGHYQHADGPASRASHVASQHTVCTSQHIVCASQHTVCTSPCTVCASQHLATVVIPCVITTVATDTPTCLLREHPMLQASTRSCGSCPWH